MMQTKQSMLQQATVKREYRAPRLSRFGTLSELTLSGLGTVVEGYNPSNKNCFKDNLRRACK